MPLKLPRGHVTAVAYTSLFLALGGAAWAAGGAITVRVRCTATRNRKHVACKVASGSGPRGPQGPPGPRGTPGAPGKSGASGPTSLTQSPAFVGTGGFAAPLYPDGTEIQHWNIDNGLPNQGGPATTTLTMQLLSPSEIAGSTAHLASVTFCYGVAASRLTSGVTKISIANATVTEAGEPATSASGVNAWQAPTYGSTTAIDTPLSLTGQSGCQTVAPSVPFAVNSDGYLNFVLTVDWQNGPSDSGGASQNTLQLGRVTATYTP